MRTQSNEGEIERNSEYQVVKSKVEMPCFFCVLINVGMGSSIKNVTVRRAGIEGGARVWYNK